MATVGRWAIGTITAVALTAGTFYRTYSDEDPPPPTNVCWADTAMSMTFVREDGRNEGLWVERFQAVTKTMPGSAWCGSFVAWALSTCDRLQGVDVSKLAWVPNWADPKRRIEPSRAKPGDVFLIWFDSKNRFAHIGIVLRNNGDGSLVTVEGNTNWRGARDGDGVHIRLRRIGPKDGVYRW